MRMVRCCVLLNSRGMYLSWEVFQGCTHETKSVLTCSRNGILRHAVVARPGKRHA